MPAVLMFNFGRRASLAAALFQSPPVWLAELATPQARGLLGRAWPQVWLASLDSGKKIIAAQPFKSVDDLSKVKGMSKSSWLKVPAGWWLCG
jgi:hypothetical protein